MIGTFFSNRDSLALTNMMREMDEKYHINKFVADQDNAENIKNIENMLKAYSDIEKSIWFKSSEINLQGSVTVILSRCFHI